MIHFTVQGKPHQLDQERLSVEEAREIKRATGLTVRAFLNGLKEYDVDAILALVWLARSRAGDQVSIEQVAASNFDLLTDFEIIKEQDQDQDDGEPVPTRGATPPEIASTSTTPPSTPSTRTSTGRTGSARSPGLSATPPPRSTR